MITDRGSVIEFARSITEKYSREALTMQKDLAAAAEQDDFVGLKNILQRALYETEKMQSDLREALLKVAELEIIQAKRALYSEQWWQGQRQTLEEAFRENPEQGFQLWLQVYTESLIAWELATCKKLVSVPFPFPEQDASVLIYFRRGLQAIEDKAYFQAIPMLNYLFLFQVSTDEAAQPLLDDSNRAVLRVFAGRIYLYKASENETALQLFEQARKLAPNDGLPCAALGNYYQMQEDSHQAQSFYQQAIELSSNRPDGYIGLGLLSEARAVWDDANDWYEEAIEAVREERNAEVALSKLLAPVSGTLYLKLARTRKEKEPEHALQIVERAISLGIKQDGQYPDPLAYRLKGEILKSLARKAEAAEAFLEAGRLFARRNESQMAIELLADAHDLDENNENVYWGLTDALRRASYRTEYPYVDEAPLLQSMKTLQAGLKRAPDPINIAWGYSEQALITEQRARLPGSDRLSHWWEAIAYLERALLLNEKAPYYWLLLGRYHRLLETNLSALQATSKAVEYDPSNTSVLDERAAILADVGEFPAAEAAIDQRREREKNLWADAVKAYILLHTGGEDEALKLLQKAIEAQPNEIWPRSLLALCYRIMDDLPGAKDDAREQNEWLWRHYQKLDAENREAYANAAYYLGKIDEAIRLFEDMLKESLDATGSTWGLGLCYLILGNVPRAEELMKQAVALAKNVRKLDDMLKLDIQQIEKLTASWSYSTEANDALARIKEHIAARRTQIEQSSSTASREEELKKVIQEHPREEGKINWVWIGAQAGLARFYSEEKRWLEAAAAYQHLQSEGERFLEARLGLEKIFAVLLAEGDARLKEGKPGEALTQFTQMLTLKLLPDDAARQAELHTRIGYIHFALVDSEHSHAHFVQAIQLYREVSTTDSGSALGAACRPLLPDAMHYWNLAADWQAWESDPAIDDKLLSDLVAARKALASYLDEFYQLSGKYPDMSEWAPLVKPIEIELASNLLPDDTSSESPLLASYIPAMRQRVKDSMGIIIPGINTRDNLAFQPDEYRLKLEDIPLARGSIQRGMRYCPVSSQALQALGIFEDSLIEVPHPLTEEPGCWLKQEDWDLVISNGLELWAEPLVFIVYHLQALLLRNLAELLTIQEVENLLAKWGENTDATPLIATALPDQLARYHFGQVLRMLVKEHVPVTQWKDILVTIREKWSIDDNVHESVRLIRLRLKKLLPGNASGMPHFELPSDLDEAIAEAIWARNDSVTSEQWQKIQSLLLNLLRSIEKEAAPRNWHVALVTRIPEIRPFVNDVISFVNDVIENGFPSNITNMVVLSQEELLTSDEPLIHAQAEDKNVEDKNVEDEKNEKGARVDEY